MDENTQPHGAGVQVLAGYVDWIDPGGIRDSLVAWERLNTYLFLPSSEVHQPRMLREPLPVLVDLITRNVYNHDRYRAYDLCNLHS